MPRMCPLRFPEAIPTLRDEAITLRSLGDEDIAPWYARATDAESADLAGDPIPASIAAGAAWLQRHRDLFERKAGIRWAIVPHGETTSVGTVGLLLDAVNEPGAELGVVVARARWRQAIGTAAVRMALRYGLYDIGLHVVRAQALQRNPASLRLLEKCGFRVARVAPPCAAEPDVMIHFEITATSTRS
ncbi:MAG: GNAT family N-acetyltransferase [Proteobacteria bacterium]|nr:GNAT family N-acetyltransferase [Pseudomonadota bacterium]